MQSPTKGSRSRSAGAASSSPAPWRAAGESLPLAVTVVIHGTPHRSRYDVFQTTTLGQLQVKIEQRYKLDRDLQRLYKDEVELQGVSRRLDRLGVTNHSIIIVQPVALVIRVKIPRQKEATLHDVVSIMTVRQLKCRIEMACGIVVAQQRLRFLEVSDLEDDTLLTDHDIISGSTLSLHLWDNWKDVYSSIIMEDNSKAIWHLLRQDWQGVSRPRGQMTLTDFDKRKPSETGWAALYLTAHLGNVALCRAFIRLQENAGDLAPHGQCHPVWPGPGLSPYGGHDECPPPSAFRQEPGTGRTPIHAAAYKGNTECVSVMLDAGSGFLVKDTDGMTAEFLAKRRNNFECAELLSMANWAHTMESYRRSLQEAKESGHTNVPYGPFHTFEISFGRTVPPGSGIMQPLDSLGAPARRGNAVLPSMVS